MGTAFSNALSGLTANALAIDVVSGNLANLNTYGFKANQVSFEDLVSQTLGGNSNTNLVGGASVPISNRQFNQGSITPTGGGFDAAIQGNGFFVLKNTDGTQAFTRAGNFKVDSLGHLLTQAGANVEGWNALNGKVDSTANIGNIVLPIAGLRQPSTTTKFALDVNLNANAAVGSTDGTFSSPMQVVDSQGNAHVLTVTYTKTAAGSWDYKVTINSNELTAGVGTTTQLATGTLVFDANGHLKTPDPASGAIAVPITGLVSGAGDMNITWNLYDDLGVPTITQYNQASANLASAQDGVQAGQLTSVTVGDGGLISAKYSNGDSVPVAQLALASVLNPGSMQDLGNNTFGVTSSTSVPAIGMPITGSRGRISGGSLEASTVDIAKEFTSLLTYQRGYQANSKVITTEDDIMQETVALKR